jgi:hypothetical protein
MHRLVPVPLLLLLLACLLDIFQAVPAGRATRSTPSAVVRVVTLDPNPPAPPADVAATGSSAGTDLTVTWRATAPDGPAGRFWFEVLDPAGPFTLLRQKRPQLCRTRPSLLGSRRRCSTERRQLRWPWLSSTQQAVEPLAPAPPLY